MPNEDRPGHAPGPAGGPHFKQFPTVHRICSRLGVGQVLGNRLQLGIGIALQMRAHDVGREIRMAIEDELDLGLPRAYDPSLYQAKCSAVFEQVFEAYLDRDRGVFAKAG